MQRLKIANISILQYTYSVDLPIFWSFISTHLTLHQYVIQWTFWSTQLDNNVIIDHPLAMSHTHTRIMTLPFRITCINFWMMDTPSCFLFPIQPLHTSRFLVSNIEARVKKLEEEKNLNASKGGFWDEFEVRSSSYKCGSLWVVGIVSTRLVCTYIYMYI